MQQIIVSQAFKIIIRDIRPTLGILLQMIFKNITNNNCRINATPIYASIPFMIVISQKNLEKSHLNSVQTNPTN